MNRARALECAPAFLIAGFAVSGLAAACSGSQGSVGPMTDMPCTEDTSARVTPCVPADVDAANVKADGSQGNPDATSDAGDSAILDAANDVKAVDVGTDDSGGSSDPCPPMGVPIVLNCNPGHECGTSDLDYERCQVASCSDGEETNAIPVARVSRGQELVLRTPARPGRNASCSACGPDSFAYAIAFKMRADPLGYRIVVDPPWNLYLMAEGTNGALRKCPVEMKKALGNSYESVLPDARWFLVATRDPAAPARNVHFHF